ncbi:MAG: DNA replication/repair protein RecF [Eggerthellaceae bacterium]|jgi:DNA replication and repair protein RecF
MPLQLSSIRLSDFRSYERFFIDGLQELTIFVGPNAVGKSNLLEAIQLTTALASFRSATAEQLIHWGCNNAAIISEITDEKRRLEVKLLLDSTGKHYLLNGKKTSVQSLHDTLPAVTFTPDDLQLVKGTPSQRRSALDALGCQLSTNYRSVKRDYEKILRQRNQLLKEQADALLIDSVNEVFIKVGAQLCRYRLQIMEDLSNTFPGQYGHIASNGEMATLSYSFSWEEALDNNSEGGPSQKMTPRFYSMSREELQHEFADALHRVADEERIRKRTLIGPHRDHLDFLLEGRPAQTYASQGQQRSLAIAFKLSEFQLILDRRHQRPILLLDDVMSEIDARRRTYLMERLQDVSQTFITTTNLGYFTSEVLEQAKVVQLPIMSADM